MNIKILILLVFISSRAIGQIIPLALNGEKVNSLSITQNGLSEQMVIAGTNSGIYFHNVNDPDSAWFNHFYGSSAACVYVQQIGHGPVDLDRIFVSILPGTQVESKIYTNDFPIQSSWSVRDSGLYLGDNNSVTSITGFNYSGHEPPMPVFCLDGGSWIFKLENDEWTMVKMEPLYNGILVLFSNSTTLWGGGSSGPSLPEAYLFKSYDYGKTWIEYYLKEGQACFSISSLPNDTSIVFAGLIGGIIKTTDGGSSWNFTPLNDNAIFTSIIINPSDPLKVYAGGRTGDNLFVFYKSSNGGMSWEEIIPNIRWNCNCLVSGITSMTGAIVDGKFVLYIGTLGSGIFKYTDNIVSVKDNIPNYPEHFQLYQNYPNPFNPVTKIKYTIKDNLLTTLKIYDILGKLVAVLVNEVKEPGEYEAIFDASALTSGVYFYELKTGDLMQTKRMILLR